MDMTPWTVAAHFDSNEGRKWGTGQAHIEVQEKVHVYAGGFRQKVWRVQVRDDRSVRYSDEVDCSDASKPVLVFELWVVVRHLVPPKDRVYDPPSVPHYRCFAGKEVKSAA